MLDHARLPPRRGGGRASDGEGPILRRTPGIGTAMPSLGPAGMLEEPGRQRRQGHAKFGGARLFHLGGPRHRISPIARAEGGR